MPKSATPPIMESNHKVETLNVNNVDSVGNVVMNDEKLLELIQMYPFLYNPRVRPFQDSDYDEWAWERITTGFNRNYEGLLPPVVYTVDELQYRWRILKPIIRRISKMYDLTVIPDPLRQMIVKISFQLEDQTSDVRPNNFSNEQKIILDNIAMVEKLPLDYRLQLESEMMDILLNAELDAKGTIRLTNDDQMRIEKEYFEFLRSLQLKELYVLTPKYIDLEPKDETDVPETKNITNENEPTKSESNGDGPEVMNQTNEDDRSISPIEVAEDLIDFETVIDETAKKNVSVPKMHNIKPCVVSLPREIALASASTPIQRWVSMTACKKFVKRCRVRLRRLNMEDYIPLSKIKTPKL